MATRKRASSRSSLLKQAVRAGRTALRSAEKRVPADLRRHIERSIEDGQKTIHKAISELRTDLARTARQADLDKALKRLEGLSKQVQEVARAAAAGATSRPAPRKAARKPARRKPAARKPATRTTSARKPAVRKSATRKPVARRTTPRTSASRRPSAPRAAAISAPVVATGPPPPGPGAGHAHGARSTTIPERVEIIDNEN